MTSKSAGISMDDNVVGSMEEGVLDGRPFGVLVALQAHLGLPVGWQALEMAATGEVKPAPTPPTSPPPLPLPMSSLQPYHAEVVAFAQELCKARNGGCPCWWGCWMHSTY